MRRAFQELVTEGVIYRVRGRGTFAVPGDGKYLRSFGSIDDLMALSLDTELQVVEPLHVLASVEIAGQLQAAEDTVMTTSFLRLHDGCRSATPACTSRWRSAAGSASCRRWPGWPSRAAGPASP